MRRRDLVIGGGLAATLFLPRVLPAKAAVPIWRLNGDWTGREFVWNRAGRDPFGAAERKQDLAIALRLLGIPQEYHVEILAKVQRIEGGKVVYNNPDRTERIVEGQSFDAMVSGGIRTAHAWVAQNIVARDVTTWATDELWVWQFVGFALAVSTVCFNILIVEVGVGVTKFLDCRKDEKKGDLYSR